MKSFGKKAWMLPQPVLILGTYNEDGTPNAMNAAWAGQWDSDEIMISIGKHKTTENLRKGGDFTIVLPYKPNIPLIHSILYFKLFAYICKFLYLYIINLADIYA